MGVVGALPGSMKEDQRFRASLGGWEKPQTVDAYVAFVGRLVQRLVQVMGSDAPRWWVTLNEPIGSIVGTGYIAGIWPHRNSLTVPPGRRPPTRTS